MLHCIVLHRLLLLTLLAFVVGEDFTRSEGFTVTELKSTLPHASLLYQKENSLLEDLARIWNRVIETAFSRLRRPSAILKAAGEKSSGITQNSGSALDKIDQTEERQIMEFSRWTLVAGLGFGIGAIIWWIRKRDRKHHVKMQGMELFLENMEITCFTHFAKEQFVSKGNLIGIGHFGKVYLRELKLGEGDDQQIVKVACKEMKPEFAQDAFDEAKVMASVQHIHVIRMLGYLDDGVVPVLVSEFMEGGCLVDHLERMRHILPLDLIQLVRFAKEAASGMAYLHSIHIVHRDLAARNCLLDKKLSLRIADFGLSRRFETYTQGYVFKCADRPMPIAALPIEGLRGHGKFTTEGDVWAYGILLWEIFSFGARPYVGMDRKEILEFLSTGERLALPELCPESIYEKIMVRCWASNPKKRPTFLQIDRDMRTEFAKYRAVDDGAEQEPQESAPIIDKVERQQESAPDDEYKPPMPGPSNRV